MHTSGLAGLILMCVLAGLGTYCAACALHVWAVRNRGAFEGLRGAAKVAKRIRSASAAILIMGLGIMGVAAAIAQLSSNEGVLQGERLYTVRIPESFHVHEVTGANAVEEGQILARFWSSERETEIAVLRLGAEELQIERHIIESRPVTASAEITRDLQDVSAEHRHVEYTINELDMEHARLAREATRDRTTKQDEMNRSQETLDTLRSELEEAQARLTLSRDRLERTQKLYQAKSVPIEEYSQQVSETAICSEEVVRIETQISNVIHQKAELEQALNELAAISARQSDSFAKELSQRKNLVKSLNAQIKGLNAQLAEDLAEAEERRRKELQQLDVQLRQTESKLAGLSAMQKVTAPFAGAVAYRATSPDTVFGDAPLLVLAPKDALRLKVRVRKSAVLPLQKAGEVRAELVQERQDDDAVDFGFVERRIAGRLAGWKPLPHDPVFVLAELSCELPPEAVRAMASGWEVRARLIWTPPLLSLPEFQGSAILAGSAGLVWLAAGFWVRRCGTTLPGGGLSVAPQPSDAVLVEFGAEGAMLHLLGSQLRDAIRSGRVEASLIAAVEWSLDRHRSRAARLLSKGLGDCENAIDALESNVKELASTPFYVGDDPARLRRDTLERLLGVLRVIAPPAFRGRVIRLQRQLRTVEAVRLTRVSDAMSNGHAKEGYVNSDGGVSR